MKKKRILLIISLIIVILVILGSLYFISHKNNSKAKIENENIINTTVDDTNTVVNSIENNIVIENVENTIDEEKNQETTETKQESQPNEISSTQTNTGISNSKTTTQNKETVEAITNKLTIDTSERTTTQQSTTQPSDAQSKKQEETKTEPQIERCTNIHNHYLDVGNSSKWFNSKNDAIAYYNQQTKYWSEQWESNKIDNDTYYKNCPSGYEVWDCIYCGKWTINFYYR